MLLGVSSLPPSSQHTSVGKRVQCWCHSWKELLSASHYLNSTHRSILLSRTTWACDVPGALGILSEREWVLDSFDKSKTAFSGSSFRDTINIQPVHVREAETSSGVKSYEWLFLKGREWDFPMGCKLIWGHPLNSGLWGSAPPFRKEIIGLGPARCGREWHVKEGGGRVPGEPGKVGWMALCWPESPCSPLSMSSLMPWWGPA